MTPEAIFATAGERTSGLVGGRDILAIQDSSDLVLGGRKRRQQGFGPVGKGGAIRGLTLHAVLAVDAHSGEVLGLAGGQVWNRTGGKVSPHASRHLEDKESLRWITGTATAARVLGKAASITVVADRESDIYEDYARRPASLHLLTRMHHNRRLVDGQKLHDQLDAQRPAGDLETVDIPAKPGHAARQAKLALRFCHVEVKAPHRGMPAEALRRLPPSCRLWAIDIREVGAARGVTPIHWRLLSTRAVGAICPARGTGAALALPYADTGADAVLLLDRAGWHTTAKLVIPANITPIFLPSRAPELNPVENIWQHLRANWLSNRVFETYEAIIEAACEAWQKLIDQPHKITSIEMRDWAHVGQSP